MAILDSRKIEDIAAENINILNVQIVEGIENVASALKGLPESELSQAYMEQLKKFEKNYNEAVLPFVEKFNDVLRSQFPELFSKIQKATAALETVKSRTDSSSVAQVDTDAIPVM